MKLERLANHSYRVNVDGQAVGVVYRLGGLPSMHRWYGQTQDGWQSIPHDTRKQAVSDLLAHLEES